MTSHARPTTTPSKYRNNGRQLVELAGCHGQRCPSQYVATDAKTFGELLFVLRSRQRMTLRCLAEKANMAASLVSEFENARRPPPGELVVSRLTQALELPPDEALLLATLASQERGGIGLRVARATPRHVADLLRDIACMGQQLSPAQVRSIRQSLEVAMP
ncbi:helix-turn-helix domain-containing protein [Simplicispira hankyongi]|uniref:XRE family transcriptional regulator n=1 Tax=Simplicispira hankyongi TaxID=2315688 RepID=A0A398CC72_9BURK|nr:XRE family transcriptional regulator [Simplicispira hankyongi]